MSIDRDPADVSSTELLPDDPNPAEALSSQQQLKCLCATLEEFAMNRPGSCYDVSQILVKKILANTKGEIRPHIRGTRMHFHVGSGGVIIDGTIAQFLITEDENERAPAFIFCGTREELISLIDEKLKTFKFRRSHPAAVNSQVKTGEDFVRFFYDHKKVAIDGDRWYEDNGRWWLRPSEPQK